MTSPFGKCQCCCHFLQGDSESMQSLRYLAPSTRMRNLMNSNEVPLRTETDTALSDIRLIEEDLSFLESTIERFECSLRTLNQAKRTMTDALRGYKSIVHPLRRFPPELLSEIFHHTCSRPQSTTSSVHNEPWNLSFVCSLWRQVAISSSELWSTISIDLEKLEGGSKYVSFLLKERLERTKNRPLTISVRAVHGNPQKPDLLSLLLPTSNRWEALSLHLPPQFLHALAPIEGNLYSLRTLELYFTGWNKIHVSAASLFSHTPCLRTLRCMSTKQLEELDIPFSQITNLESCNIFHGISYFTAIETLKVNQCRISQPIEPCTLGYLRVLELIADPIKPFPCFYIFRSITLPALELLHVEGAERTGNWISEFLQRSSCPLKEIRLGIKYLSEAELEHILEAAPSLKRLAFVRYQDDTYIQAVEVLKRRSDLCSILRAIGWVERSSIGFDIVRFRGARPAVQLLDYPVFDQARWDAFKAE